MAVTYRSRKRTVPYRTRLTGRLISCNEGFGVNAPGPSPFGPTRSHSDGVIPGRARHEPGIHSSTGPAAWWIPGSRCASPRN